VTDPILHHCDHDFASSLAASQSAGRLAYQSACIGEPRPSAGVFLTTCIVLLSPGTGLSVKSFLVVGRLLIPCTPPQPAVALSPR
jgi:hypothetical protein